MSLWSKKQLYFWFILANLCLMCFDELHSSAHSTDDEKNQMWNYWNKKSDGRKRRVLFKATGKEAQARLRVLQLPIVYMYTIYSRKRVRRWRNELQVKAEKNKRTGKGRNIVKKRALGKLIAKSNAKKKVISIGKLKKWKHFLG